MHTVKRVTRSVVNTLMTSLEPRSLSNMPNLRRLLKYVSATSSAFFFHQNIFKNSYFQITKKNGSEISLHAHFKSQSMKDARILEMARNNPTSILVK